MYTQFIEDKCMRMHRPRQGWQKTALFSKLSSYLLIERSAIILRQNEALEDS